MLIASFPAGPWQTNCYVLATGPRAECVIVDPGMGSAAGVAEVVAEHHLHPAAVLVTHGHLDHMFAVTPVCSRYRAVCWVHPGDRRLLTDPLAGMGPDAALLLAQVTGGAARLEEPDEVRELVDGAQVEVAGLTFDVRHAPGHTPGSVLFGTPYAGPGPARPGAPAAGVSSLALVGDVLFAGSIGRTDLPGGNDAAMRTTLREVVSTLPDDTLVLPGHGPRTTLGSERIANPYLQSGYLGAGLPGLGRRA